MRRLAIALAALCLALGTISAQAASARCGSLPAAGIQVASGFCAGLVATRLGTPRGVLPLADGSVLVADMGSWERGRGRLLRLSPAGDGYSVSVLARGLNRPHGLVLGPDGLAYLGEDQQVSRFDPKAAEPVLQPVITGLPADGQHPLKSLAFLPDGSLLVGVGSASNNCEGNTGPTCAEAEGDKPRGALWRFEAREGTWVGRPWARGLRNPMALVVDAATGRVWQGENGRDGIQAAFGRDASDEDTPHDELNLVVDGGRYGWPYCHDAGLPSPEFPAAACKAYTPPWRLLPAHAAPLGLAIARQTNAPPNWRAVMLITQHGYRRHGHRVVGIALDAAGLPRGPARDLISAPPGPPARGRLGSFTDVKVDAAGIIWVTDDRAGTVLRIAPAR